jgi:hypothetical protein
VGKLIVMVGQHTRGSPGAPNHAIMIHREAGSPAGAFTTAVRLVSRRYSFDGAVDTVVIMSKRGYPAMGLGPPQEAIARALGDLRTLFGAFQKRGLFEKGYTRQFEKPLAAQTLDTILHKIVSGIPLEGEERWIVLATMRGVHRPPKKKRGPAAGTDYGVRDAIIVSAIEALMDDLGQEGLHATRNSATKAPSAASIVCEALGGNPSEKQIGRIWQAHKRRLAIKHPSAHFRINSGACEGK